MGDQRSVAIVGAGIVGLATALRLSLRFPGAKISLFEKENRVAAHQSGRNSGVLHSGIYYAPGSFKAVLCRSGKLAMERFCDEAGIPHAHPGKLIVATQADQLGRLEALFERGQANGIACRKVSPGEARQLEPEVESAGGLLVPETGIVDYVAVCQAMARRLQDAGHTLHVNTGVARIVETARAARVESSIGAREFDWCVNCAGLHSDEVSRASGARPGVRIVAFRGEYFELVPPRSRRISHLVYPVPDPRFPFLGVHLTPTIDGRILCGPNAVMAFAKEGYRWGDIELSYLAGTLTYGGFLRLAVRYWKTGLGEIARSLSKPRFTSALRAMLPEVSSRELSAAPAGVRAQALGPKGAMLDDFAFKETERSVHVVNAPSPAATASLAIADHIVDRLAARW